MDDDIVSSYLNFSDFFGKLQRKPRYTMGICQQDKTQGCCKTINKAELSWESWGLCYYALTMKSLIKTPNKFRVIKRPFWKPRNKEENGKQCLFHSHCFQQNILETLSFSWNTEKKEDFKAIFWSLFLKALFFFTSVVIGVPADKSASDARAEQMLLVPPVR